MANPTVVFAALTILGLVISTLYNFPRKAPKNTRPPPGPKPRFLVGSLFEIPKIYPFLKLTEWGRKYGPLMRFSVLGKDTYVISTEKVANHLLRDRGAIYSSRPVLPASGVLLGNNQFPVLLPADPAEPERTAVWKKGRTFAHQILGFSSVPKYARTHDLESSRLIDSLIKDPSDYEVLFDRYAASIVFRLGYGKPVQSGQEYYVRRSLELLHEFEKAVMPGNYLVDIFPSMMKIPTFLAPFKQYLLARREATDLFFLELLDIVRQGMKEGTAPPSFAKTLLENQKAIGLSDLDSAHLVGTLYGAGAGSTSATLAVLMLKLVHNPEWLKRMQQELDEQVGAERLPTFEDMPNLPTVRAVVKEVVRLSSQGLPHKLIKDDVYEGYYLPAGASVLPNLWAINRDPELYPDPEAFNPGRWLSPEFPTYREPLSKYPNLQQYSSFGFGRRICPGHSLAERSLNIATARIAWACDIAKKIGPDGKEIHVPVFDYTTNLISRPRPFAFALSARSEARVRVLEMHCEAAAQADPLLERSSYQLAAEEE